MSTYVSQADHPLATFDDDWQAISSVNPDCRSLWFSVGSTIQVAREMAREHQREGHERDEFWLVDDWDNATEMVYENIEEGVEKLQDQACEGSRDLNRVLSELGSRGDFVGGPVRVVENALVDAEEVFKDAAPDGIIGRLEGGEEVYVLQCAEGSSAAELQSDFNNLPANGEPEELQVEWAEGSNKLVACVLVEHGE